MEEKQPTHSNNLSNVKREISAIKSKFGQNVKIFNKYCKN